MGHDCQVRIVAEDGFAVRAKVTIKVEPVLLYQCTYGNVYSFGRLVLAILVHLHKQLVALPVLPG